MPARLSFFRRPTEPPGGLFCCNLLYPFQASLRLALSMAGPVLHPHPAPAPARLFAVYRQHQRLPSLSRSCRTRTHTLRGCAAHRWCPALLCSCICSAHARTLPRSVGAPQRTRASLSRGPPTPCTPGSASPEQAGASCRERNLTGLQSFLVFFLVLINRCCTDAGDNDPRPGVRAGEGGKRADGGPPADVRQGAHGLVNQPTSQTTAHKMTKRARTFLVSFLISILGVWSDSCWLHTACAGERCEPDLAATLACSAKPA